MGLRIKFNASRASLIAIACLALVLPVSFPVQATHEPIRPVEGTETGLWFLDAQDDTGPVSLDSSGNGNHLTKVGTLPVATSASPKFLTGYAFVAGGGYLRQTSSDLEIAGDFSTLVAFNYADTDRSMLITHWTLGESISTNILYAIGIDQSGTLSYSHEYGAGTNFVYNTGTVVTPGPHVVYAIRQGTSLTLYLDGALAGTTTWSSTQAPDGGNSGYLLIGDETFAARHNGAIHEVRIWDHAVSLAILEHLACTNNPTCFV